MIIGFGGWERCLKTGFAAILASHPEEFNIEGMQTYDIKNGYGNLHLFKTPYPWHYMRSFQLINFIRNIPQKHITDSLIFIDEADEVFNPRNYGSKDQTECLKHIGQHAKMGNIFLYTYQKGQPDDQLLGVDKILRSNTRIDFELRHYNIKEDYAIYKIESRLTPETQIIEGVLENVSQYFEYWNTKEPVI